MNDAAAAADVRKPSSRPPPPPRDLPRQCSGCGRVMTAAEYDALRWKPWPDLELEIAVVPCCGTTIGRVP